MKKSTKKRIITNSHRETQLAGVAFGVFLKKLPFSASHRALVVALKGNLGSGKTTFVQGVAKGLGIKEKILSPTFVIVKRFHVSSFRFHDFYHIDCYRIKKAQDLLELGWEEIVANPQNIILLEWPERVQKILPKNTISISFETIKTSKRRITFS